MMLAYHNDPKIKQFYLKRVKAHAKADEIIKGKYWENGKGCAVGCTIHSAQHFSYETELGIPGIIAKLEDRIFEGLPLDLAKTWPERFLKAIKPGADLSKVWFKFASRLLTDPISGVIQYAKTEEQLEVIQRVSDLYEAKILDIEVPIQEWRDSGNAADDADAAYAAAYAAYAADDAAADAAAFAADAADDADDAALERAYIWQSELLLELLEECK